MRARFVSVFFASLLAVGGEGCAPDEGAPTLELGSGESRFVAVSPGDEVELVRGSQGGYHVWLSLRAHGLAGERMQMLLEVEPADGSMATQESHVRVFLDEGADVSEYVGWPALIQTPECFVGRDVRVRAALTDDAGRTAVGEVVVVPVRDDMGECLEPSAVVAP